MKSIAVALFLLLAPCAFAQWTEPAIPLTNTRYGPAATTDGVLTSNGRDTFLVWSAPRAIVMTRIVDGERRVGRPLFTIKGETTFDVVWTGAYFLAAASIGGQVVGRLADASGEPVGGQFVLVQSGRHPRLATNRAEVLLAYDANGSRIEAVLLDATGAPTNPGATIRTAADFTYDTTFDAASNGSGFAILTASKWEVRVTLVTRQGQIAAEPTPYAPRVDTRRAAAIASDGEGYLAVWGSVDGLEAATIARDGTMTDSFTIEPAGTKRAVAGTAVAWTGSRYTAMYYRGCGNALYVADVDTQRRAVAVREESSHPCLNLTLLSEERSRAGWFDAESGSFMVADLDDLANATIVTYAAAEQELGASATSPTGTLVAWSEVIGNEQTLHSGVRRPTGAWVEQRLGADEIPLAAASDGFDFMLLTGGRGGWSAMHLDPDGKLISRSPRIAMGLDEPDPSLSLTWDGRDYVVAYVTERGDPAIVRVSRAGVVSAPKVLGKRGMALRIAAATNGTSYFVMWEEWGWNGCIPCEPFGLVYGMRLRNDFSAIDETPLFFSSEDALLAGPAWLDGTYYAYYAREYGLEWHRIPASGPLPAPLQPIRTSGYLAGESTLGILTIGNTAVIWSRRNEHRAVVHQSYTYPREDFGEVRFDSRDVIALPGGRTTYLGLVADQGAPHHGASRLMLEVRSSALAPDAPHATLKKAGSEFRIEWEPPTRPVYGYRVEYRIGDGSWNEIGRWFDADERTATWSSLVSGQTYSFRVRAFGDGGVSGYSAPVTGTATGRRRSVRR